MGDFRTYTIAERRSGTAGWNLGRWRNAFEQWIERGTEWSHPRRALQGRTRSSL
jgi:hypothetical protein